MEENHEFTAKPLEERTEREIELTKILLQRKSIEKLKAIDDNLKFFFWLTMIGFLIYVFIFIIPEFPLK